MNACDKPEPANPSTTDGRPPRLSSTCSLCNLDLLTTLAGSDVRICRHCDVPCVFGVRHGCLACLNGASA